MDREALRATARNWDHVAQPYLELLGDELDGKPFDRDLLEEFAGIVRATGLPAADIGCGPGHVSRHLTGLGVSMVGLDLSPRMIEIARQVSPQSVFEVGDMLEKKWPKHSLGGAVLFYSLINVSPEDLPALLGELSQAIAPGGALLIGTHAGDGRIEVEELLGRPVAMTSVLYRLEDLEAALASAGFEVVLARLREPYPSEYPTERAYVLGRR